MGGSGDVSKSKCISDNDASEIEKRCHKLLFVTIILKNLQSEIIEMECWSRQLC